MHWAPGRVLPSISITIFQIVNKDMSESESDKKYGQKVKVPCLNHILGSWLCFMFSISCRKKRFVRNKNYK